MKKFIALMMSMALICTAFAGCGQKADESEKTTEAADNSEDYGFSETQAETEFNNYDSLQNGDTFTFGEYPQNPVEDDVLIAELDKLISADKWVNMNHYSIYHTDVNVLTYGKSGNWWYQDVEYNGRKYRALSMLNTYSTISGIESCRWVGEVTVATGPVDEPDWYSFEPISWKILDKENGVVVCEKIMDAQEYNYNVEVVDEVNHSPRLSLQAYNVTFADADGYCCTDSTLTTYAGDYTTSHLREWMNGTFYNTAFSVEEQNIIAETSLTYEQAENAKYQTKETNDKVYVLSDADLTNHDKYNFNPSARGDAEDENRVFEYTPYAMALCGGYENVTSYWTRTSDIRKISVVDNSGGFFNNSMPFIIRGVLPALTVDMKNAVK